MCARAKREFKSLSHVGSNAGDLGHAKNLGRAAMGISQISPNARRNGRGTRCVRQYPIEPLESRTLFSSGTLDPGFGRDGTVSIERFPIDSYDFDMTLMAVQPDGKILVAGDVSRGLDDDNDDNDVQATAVIRLNGNGSIDRQFGTRGAAILDDWEITAVALQPDGKIIIATGGIGVTRLHPDGSIDTAFGNAGTASTDYDRVFASAAVAILPDGRIVVGGTSFKVNDSAQGSEYDFALTAYLPDGRPDPSFGAGGPDGDGNVRTDVIGSKDWLEDLAVQPDGRIVAVGTTENGTLFNDFAVVRYLPDGGLDPSFGRRDNPGRALVNFGFLGVQSADNASAVALQPDGKIIVAGSTRTPTLLTSNFALARLTDSGQPDTSFGDGKGLPGDSFGTPSGRVITEFGKGFDFAYGVLLQDDGRIIVAGLVDAQTRWGQWKDYDRGLTDWYGRLHHSVVGLARYTDSGKLDGKSVDPFDKAVDPVDPFGDDGTGLLRLDYGRSVDVFKAMAFQPDGGLIVAAWPVDLGVASSNVISRLNVQDPRAIPQPASGVNLVAREIAGSLPPSVIGGSRGKGVSVVVANEGTEAARGEVNLALFASSDTTVGDDDTLIAEVPIRVNLKAGRAKAFKLKFDYPSLPDGSYYLLARADGANAIVEQNESDNDVASSQPVVMGAPFVDLGLVGPVTAPTDIRPGRKSRVSVEVRNNGNIATGRYDVLVNVFASADGTVDGSDRRLVQVAKRLSLKPGATRILRLSVPILEDAAGAPFFMVVELQPVPPAPDTNASNNTAATSAAVGVFLP